MQESEKVEISADQLYIRTKEDPEKWPIEGPDVHLSSLKADVPEFVPGKMYQRTGGCVLTACVSCQLHNTGDIWLRSPLVF